MPELHDSRLLTAKQAATLLAISPRTLWTLTQRGELPVVRFGANVRYAPEALARFVESKTSPAKK